MRCASGTADSIVRSLLVAAALVGGVTACVSEASLVKAPAEERGAEVHAPAVSARVPASLARAPLRRLTAEHYDHAVRDLFGEPSHPAEAFGPDDLDGGFEANSTAPLGQAGLEHYARAAETVASAALNRLGTLAPCTPEGSVVCGRDFIERVGRLVYRRPLDVAERAALLDAYTTTSAAAGHARAVQRVLERMLLSPKFLYRLELPDGTHRSVRPLDGFELATRLSFFLWASTPDGALLDEAAAGTLDTTKGLATVARRMLRDPRAVDGVRSFFRQWLDLRELATLSRDPERYPRFTPDLRRAMVEETLRFGARVVFQGGDGVRELLTSRLTFVNHELANVYGLRYPVTEGYAAVELPRGARSGLLTQPSLMAVLTHSDATAPILRGKFVREKLLCQPVPPPPPGVAMQLPAALPNQTKRQRFARHRSDPSCAGCHQMMEPLGFAFERYDAIGVLTPPSSAAPVDAAGALVGTDVDGPVDGAVELGARLAESAQVRRCIATQWFRAAVGRGERPEDEPSIEGAFRAFERAGFDLRELVVALTLSDSFRFVQQRGGTAR